MERVGVMDEVVEFTSTPLVEEMKVPEVLEELKKVEEVIEAVADPEVKPRDPDAELYKNGPTWRQIEGWKAQYGDIYVTAVAEEKYIIWRTLTRSEYRLLVRALESSVASGKASQAEANLDNEEAVAQTCMLHPKMSAADMNGDMAGIPSIISQQVLEASGFVSIEVRQL